jgi:hypothetical protein
MSAHGLDATTPKQYYGTMSQSNSSGCHGEFLACTQYRQHASESCDLHFMPTLCGNGTGWSIGWWRAKGIHASEGVESRSLQKAKILCKSKLRMYSTRSNMSALHQVQRSQYERKQLVGNRLDCRRRTAQNTSQSSPKTHATSFSTFCGTPTACNASSHCRNRETPRNIPVQHYHIIRGNPNELILRHRGLWSALIPHFVSTPAASAQAKVVA